MLRRDSNLELRWLARRRTRIGAFESSLAAAAAELVGHLAMVVDGLRCMGVMGDNQ
jgi:hypothetical protein